VIAILRHEILTLVRDGRFWATGGLFTVLVLLCIVIGLNDQRDRAQNERRLTRELRSQWESQKDKDPHAAGHFGTYVVKPTGPTSWLDPGVEPYVGTLLFLEPHIQNEFTHRPATESTTLRHFGHFSLAFLLQVIAPLIVILFCYASFAGDRESGALRLLISTGMKPIDIVAGKIIGNLAGLALLIFPSLLLSGIVLSSGGQAGTSLPSLGLLLLGYLLYLAAFAGLTLAVSAFVAKSQVALAAMVFVWIVTCFVLPRTVSDFAAARNPLPSKAAFTDRIAQEVLKGIDGHDPLDKRREPLLRATLEKHGVKRVEDLPVNFDALALQASEEYA
jgi:ABC-2 type transport system permease protein